MGLLTRDPADKAGHTTQPFIGTREQTGRESAGRAVKPKDAEVVLAQELLAEIRLMRETNSEVAAHFRSGVLNEVLAVRMVVLDADGTASLEFRSMVGSVVVANHNAAGNITVSSSPKAASVGNQGSGQFLIRPGVAASVPIGSHTVTLYGTAGNVVSVQAFTSRVPPFSGAC